MFLIDRVNEGTELASVGMKWRGFDGGALVTLHTTASDPSI